MSTPQATVLAWGSVGMVLARAGALTAVATFLAVWLRRQAQTVRQQRRECCDEAEAKRGDQRQALCVEHWFVPRLAWGLSRWQGTQLALALAATPRGTRFTVWAIRVVDRGCAMPVAWTLLPANQPHAWRRAWLRLWRTRRPALPMGWTVIVLAERGLSAGWRFRRILRLGWPPCWRIQAGGPLRPSGQARLSPLRTFTPQVGTCGRGTGPAFKSPQRRLHGTLWACWEAGSRDPGLSLTDGPPEASEACWYGLRAWIAQGFKRTKRAGWPGQRTRMTEPQRAARLWLAVAVATWWRLSVGGAAEATIPEGTRLDVSAALACQRWQHRATRLRWGSIVRRGWILLLVALLTPAPLPLGACFPEPWPTRQTLDGRVMVLHAGGPPAVAA